VSSKPLSNVFPSLKAHVAGFDPAGSQFVPIVQAVPFADAMRTAEAITGSALLLPGSSCNSARVGGRLLAMFCALRGGRFFFLASSLRRVTDAWRGAVLFFGVVL
jgi:hypothetical protein